MNIFAGRKLIATRVSDLVVMAALCLMISKAPAELPAPWPKEVAVSPTSGIAVVREEEDRKEFVYRSEHYEFVSDVRLSKSVVSKFSRLFEATYAALDALPLGHTLRIPGPPRQTHFRTRLFLTDASYRSAGGPASSAGVFVGRTGEVLVPLSSLGVKAVGRRVILDPKSPPTANHTLIHELVHQLTARDQGGTHIWYREGLAEYLASCPYHEGRFSFEQRSEAMKIFLSNQQIIKCLDIKSMLTISRISFYESQGSLGPQNSRNYHTALLLTDFLIHRDPRGAALPGETLRSYLKAIESGTDADAAAKQLLAGRNYEEFERDLADSWRKDGLILEFEEMHGAHSSALDTNRRLNPR